MPQTQDTAAATSAPVQFEPVPATSHVRVVTDTTPIIPARRSIFPLAPWRMVVIGCALITAVPCGIAAAAPIWNGADLAVLIILGAFVAAFTPGRY